MGRGIAREPSGFVDFERFEDELDVESPREGGDWSDLTSFFCLEVKKSRLLAELRSKRIASCAFGVVSNIDVDGVEDALNFG